MEDISVLAVTGQCQHPPKGSCRFFPGTFLPYMDLSADDSVSTVSVQQSEQEDSDNIEEEQSGVLVNVSAVIKKFPAITQSGPNEDLTNSITTFKRIAIELDQLVPDTQRGYSNLAASQLHSMDAQHLDDLLPDTQVGYTIHYSSLGTEISRTGSFESSSDLNSAIETPQKLSCRERKRLIVPMNRPAKVTKAMKAWVAKTNYLLDPFREDDECWFHPSPPPSLLTATGTLRPYGKIQKAFAWQDHKGKHSIVLNFGIVSKLLLNKLTKQQKDGFISKQWHLSHLCGNWTCLSPAHTTVEPGSVNISRNNCFSHRSGCGHKPPCLKDRKVFLDADGKQVDPALPAPLADDEASQASAGHVDWEGWRQYDVDEVMERHDAEELESMAASIAGEGTSMGFYD